MGGDWLNRECGGGRSGCGNGRERGNGRLGDVVGGSYGTADSVTLDVTDILIGKHRSNTISVSSRGCSE